MDYLGMISGERFPNKKDRSAHGTFYNLRIEKADLAPVGSSASKDPTAGTSRYLLGY